jgi:hypothetical protein
MARSTGFVAALLVLGASLLSAEDPWIIVDDVVITEPMEVGDVIIAVNGSLTVTGVPAPGLQVTGNLWVVNFGRLVLEDSVIQFMGTYHGQYALAAAENATVEITGCDYRVPNGVQHAIFVTGDAELDLTDTVFGGLQQLLTAGDARMRAERLNGNFEVLVQNDSRMELTDIPRDPGGGDLWVWVEFPPDSEAVYTPPMPGFIDSWSFPPQGATGILQTVQMERCEAKLWPMLVREGSTLTLKDIPEDNWIVVGLFLYQSTEISNLVNNLTYVDEVFAIGAHDIRLENASIDTWNLYPNGVARVRVRDSLLGEILTFGSSRVDMWNTTIDGSGGFFGSRDTSTIVAWDCFFTSTIEAAHDSTIELHRSVVHPYPTDTTGDWTRFGAYDQARLLADHTPVDTTPALGGSGLIAVTFLANPPAHPPVPGSPADLFGYVAQFSADETLVPGSWSIEAVPLAGGPSQLIATGDENVEEDSLGTWSDSESENDQVLVFELTDGWDRTLEGRTRIRGSNPRHRRVKSTAE